VFLLLSAVVRYAVAKRITANTAAASFRLKPVFRSTLTALLPLNKKSFDYKKVIMEFKLDKNFQALTNVTAVSLTALLLFLMYLSYPTWRITLDFNAIGEAWMEVIVLTGLLLVTGVNFVETALQIREWKRQNGGLRSLL